MGKKIIHNLFNMPIRFLVISFIICLIMGMVHTGESASRASSDFITLYPGIFTEKEKAIVEKYIADNKALEDRGEIDVQALINGTLPEDTPGVGPVLKVTEPMVRYNNKKYDPENPVLNNAEYAKELGYQDILAYPTFGAHDDSFLVAYPAAARDTMLVSDLNHTVINYKPVYPGDTLYLVVNSRHVIDLTPEQGSIYRSVGIQTKGSVYNQKGEKVNDLIFRVTENPKVYKEDRRPEQFSSRDSIVDWTSRPVHYYTDENWDYIKELWSKEKRRGADPLYWEDVEVGDEPVWTVDGPIEETVRPTEPYGMGTGGSRTLKKEIMDTELFKTLIRGEGDGIYRLPDREDYVPAVPGENQSMGQMMGAPSGGGTSPGGAIDRQPETRSQLMNMMGRDIAIRHINNWMGDHGWLYEISWRLVSHEGRIAADGYVIPVNPMTEHYLEKVPYMKGIYKDKIIHGLTRDLAIVKSYVYDKYVLDGEFFVELAWWIENVEGDIWKEGGATVKLPSKNVK